MTGRAPPPPRRRADKLPRPGADPITPPGMPSAGDLRPTCPAAPRRPRPCGVPSSLLRVLQGSPRRTLINTATGAGYRVDVSLAATVARRREPPRFVLSLAPASG